MVADASDGRLAGPGDRPERVPESEVVFRASRAGGPGGQHVNKTSTRIEAYWNVAQSPGLTDDQRARLRARLGRRLDREGVLRVVCAAERSQYRNRCRALERLREIVEAALRIPKPRKKMRPPRAAKENRLREKRLRGAKKRRRARPEGEE